MKILILSLLLVFAASTKAETQYDPYVANPFEGRVGIVGQPDQERLRLDIGMTYDLFELWSDDESKLNFGTDWMVWTRLQSEGRFKFPVETSDYWFGVNMSYVEQRERSKNDIIDLAEWGLRLRLAHISSHLVDGYSDRDQTPWQFLKNPFVYSREFVELTAYVSPIQDLRIYGGASILFSTIPDGFDILTPQLGFDYDTEIMENSAFRFLSGYDFKLVPDLSSYNATHAAQIGTGYFAEQGRGVALFLYYYSGNSMHGMFFMDRDEYIGLGMQVYFY